jgi:hypothetical protein
MGARMDLERDEMGEQFPATIEVNTFVRQAVAVNLIVLVEIFLQKIRAGEFFF